MRTRFPWTAMLVAGSLPFALAAIQDEADPRRTEIWEPVPPVVDPGGPGRPPSDAVVLFDGTSLDAWRGRDGGPARWRIERGALTVAPGTGDIVTREGFGDVQLHIEWRTPAVVRGEGQDRGNSGVYLMSRYEVQILDSWRNRTYVNGQAGAIYKQFVPLVNAARPPGEWQSYDIVFRAPRFDAEGAVLRPATMTVFWNGLLVHDHVRLRGSTTYRGEPAYERHGEREPLLLQDHGSPVSFRNIWLRPLPEATP